ncbi:MAG TPA: glycosyl hydrolase family 18 protein [Candidatus Limnocylindrales bacterium]|nr:glycosyl hydrolase family 18 protein [Candidatus Limnocylindrales bacterium]
MHSFLAPPAAPPGAHPLAAVRVPLAVGLVLLLAATAAPVSAHPSWPADPFAAGSGADDGVTLAAAGPIDGTSDSNGDGGVTADLASIQWLHAQEHAMDVIDFEPGARVTVPFSPRSSDTWAVDGAAPRALPAGNATGRQMRDAPQGSTWAAGAPLRGAAASAPNRGDGLDGTVDQPSSPLDALADPASVSAVGTAGEAATGGVQTTAAVSSSGLRREIFGFLPYWEMTQKSTTLDWRTLSTVAYFSVGCNSSGSLAKRNPDGSATTGWAGWTSSKMTSIINAAHDHHTRVVLTVSCFAWTSSGASVQAELLRSSTARATLAKQIAAAVRDRGADGANLDFEPIAAGYADEFAALVRKVRAELSNVAKGYQLTFDAMASIGNQPIAAATAPGGADAVFVMGYDYRTAGSAYAGSISPLSGPTYDLGDTIDAYLTKVSPSKIILGVPYYGRAWSTASSTVHAPTLSQAKYGASAVPLYAQALEFALSYGRHWDSLEQGPWTSYRKQTCTSTYGCVSSWRQLYYDDATSLKRRYDLVNREQLRGVGIWALGFEGTHAELRNALADKFLTDRTAPVVGIATLPQTERDEGFRVAWKSWDDSAIAGYDVEMSADGGPWHRWYTATRSTSGIYPGHDGHTYAFRVRATDVHGNASGWSGAGSVTSLGVPSAIKVGGFATVRTDGLRMRTSPSTGATVMTTLDVGDALRVIGGPVSAGGYTWFQVMGPIRQWAPVDAPQVGGWIAASGNGVTNAGPRRPVYATRVDAGITGLRLNDGGLRVLTPKDPAHDSIRVTWTNEVGFDSLSLRVFRLDRTVIGSVRLYGTGAGSHAYEWNGRVGGSLLPSGTYVLQVQGKRGSAVYSAPSATPVSTTQVSRFGIIVAAAVPTKVTAFGVTPVSPTRSGDLTYRLLFGGAIRGLGATDITRTGTATGCHVGTPTGSGATWTIRVTGCGPGSVQLALRARSVTDAVSNIGPSTTAFAARVVIDRTAPRSTAPRVALRSGVALASASTDAKLAVGLSWSATDGGGAGVRDYDVRRSVDGGAWADLAVDTTSRSMLIALTPGHEYRFQVRARDRAGNVGTWTSGPAIPVLLRQNQTSALSYSGTWKLVSASGYSGGSVRYATAAGASVRYAFTGRSVAVVLSRRPDGGKVKVYVDGSYVTTINTSATAAAYRQLLFARSWSTAGTHSLRLVVVGGTTGHARVDFDAIALLR